MAGVNKIVRSVAPKSLFESAQALVDSTISWNQGDLIYLDTTNHLLKVVTAETQSANFMGVARVTIVSGKIASPYNTDVVASQSIADVPGPQVGVVAKLVLKTGDSLAPGQQVGLYPAAGTRGVSSTITTNAVGVYQGPTIASATAGQEIEVYLGRALIGGDIQC
jgi:hypothetical protein